MFPGMEHLRAFVVPTVNVTTPPSFCLFLDETPLSKAATLSRESTSWPALLMEN
jgi:hypothetical protein